MNNDPAEIQHKGITITRTSCCAVKKGVVYKSFQIADYSTGKRKRWTFANLKEAERKAKEIADFKSGGGHALFAISPFKRVIQAALEMLARSVCELTAPAPSSLTPARSCRVSHGVISQFQSVRSTRLSRECLQAPHNFRQCWLQIRESWICEPRLNNSQRFRVASHQRRMVERRILSQQVG